MDPQPRRPRQPVQIFSFHYLIIVPVLLAIATAASLFFHSDTNVAMLFSQCHARSRIPWLSHIPVIGVPSCSLISFFQEALASARAFAAMSVILSFIAGLLTVSIVESSRICNGPNILIAYPTGAWVVFNLMGGAIVWELVIIPAFFHRSRQIMLARRAGSDVPADRSDPVFGSAMRHLAAVSEVVAIPVAVVLGYVVPSVLMLIFDEPITIGVWLFFPVWVSLARQVVRYVTAKLHPRPESIHLESHKAAWLSVYAAPIICSVLSHGLLIWSLATQRDDRKEMTRSTIKFIEIDVFYIALTVLYWLLVEAGWKVCIVMVVASALLGPGAGICVGWIYREAIVDPDRAVTVVAVGARDQDSNEETPLLR